MTETKRKIHAVVDIDGVAVAQNTIPNPLYDTDPDAKLLPRTFRRYKKNYAITVNYNHGNYIYLLLPGLLEMLHFYLTQLRDVVIVSFFSAGPEGRNIRLVETIKNTVARNAGVNPDTFEYKVFSSHHCVTLPKDSKLQPDSSNNPHIPDGSNFWQGKDQTRKKILRGLYGDDISNVVFFDNSCLGITLPEIDNHAKVPTFYGFSGSDFVFYQARENTYEQQLNCNIEFLENDQFFKVNLASFMTGVMSEIIIAMMKLKISASQALKLLQVCLDTNKYKHALYQNPIYERYEPGFYYQGFLILSKIHPLQLYAPYPDHALEALGLLCERYNAFIKYFLMSVTSDYWPPHIYHIISKYYGSADDTQPQQALLSPNASMNHSDTLSEKPVAAEIEQSTVDAEKDEATNRRDPVLFPNSSPSKQGLFSQQDKTKNGNAIPKRSTAEAPLIKRGRPISNGNQPEPKEIKVRCCALL